MFVIQSNQSRLRALSRRCKTAHPIAWTYYCSATAVQITRRHRRPHILDSHYANRVDKAHTDTIGSTGGVNLETITDFDFILRPGSQIYSIIFHATYPRRKGITTKQFANIIAG